MPLLHKVPARDLLFLSSSTWLYITRVSQYPNSLWEAELFKVPCSVVQVSFQTNQNTKSMVCCCCKKQTNKSITPNLLPPSPKPKPLCNRFRISDLPSLWCPFVIRLACQCSLTCSTLILIYIWGEAASRGWIASSVVSSLLCLVLGVTPHPTSILRAGLSKLHGVYFPLKVALVVP